MSQRDWVDAHLANAAFDIHHDDPAFGYRFIGDESGRLWLTDIIEHPTHEGRLYLCAVKDVFSNRIAGYSIDTRMTSDLAVKALRMTAGRRKPTAPVTVHSDRGSQFRSRKYQYEHDRDGPIGSMGRVGAVGDNAATKSFLSLRQKNVLNSQPWATREQLRIALVTWIEKTYHRERRQRALGRRSASCQDARES